MTPRVAADPAKLEWVNALRGLAILGVILCHTYYLAVPDHGSASAPWPVMPPLGRAFAAAGARGVQLFFVASAFTLFRSMNGPRRLERRPVLNFFLRRFFRIAPLYYLGMLGYGLWHVYADGDPVTAKDVWSNLFFVHGFWPETINYLVPGGWSISAEMLFYCAVPLLVRWIRSVNGAAVFVLGALAVNYAFQTALHQPPSGEQAGPWADFLFYALPNQVPVFGLGILLYFVHHGGPASVFNPTLALAVVGAALFGLVAAEAGAWPAGALGANFLFGLAFVALALALRRSGPGLLINPVLSFLGEISFSLYLVHFLVLFVAQKLHWIDVITPHNGREALVNLGLRVLLATAASVPLAYATYELIEVRFQAVGKRLIARLEK